MSRVKQIRGTWLVGGLFLLLGVGSITGCGGIDSEGIAHGKETHGKETYNLIGESLVGPTKAIHRTVGATTSTLAAAAPAAAGSVGINGLNYNGGAVMTGTVNLYYIYYGTWSAGDKQILNDFAGSIAPSPYYNINTGYFDSTGKRVSNSVLFGGATTDNYSLGKVLTDANIQSIASSAITSGRLPKDSNGVYMVLTATDVTESGSGTAFCTDYCGWHTAATISATNIKYAFVGNASVACPAACRVKATSPNGSPGADAMASVVAHELEESTTDPNLNAWATSTPTGLVENADKCANSFSSTYIAPNGSTANNHLGLRDFLIQDNWVNGGGGFCSQRVHAAGDITADFKTDIALAGGVGWGSVPVAKSIGDGSFSVVNVALADFPGFAQAPGAKLVAGDFNGDGRSDVALTGGSDASGAPWASIPVAFSNGNGSFQVANVAITSFGTWATLPGALPVPGDFDGDGRTDIALAGGFFSPGVPFGSIPIAFSNGDGSFRVVNTPVASFGTWATLSGSKPVSGDFDGDGRSDVALAGGFFSPGVPFGSIPIAFSNGDGSFRVVNTALADFGAWASAPGSKPVAGDFNGDGRGDIAVTGGFFSPGVPFGSVPIAFSNGDGSFQTANLAISNFGTWATLPGAKPVSGDFDGDGRGDVALTGGFFSPGVPFGSVPVAFSNGDGSFRVVNTAINDFGTWATQSGVQPAGGY